MADWSDFAGLTVDEARAKGQPYGIKTVRVIAEDGVHGLVTADYRTDRLNVETAAKNGVQRIIGKPYTG